MSNGDFWSADIWTKFNGKAGDATQPGLLRTTMGPMQVAQHVFPTFITGTDNPIPADIIDLKGIPSRGVTRSFATLQKPFQLFSIHVSDPALTMATNQVTLAGQALALAEDRLFFQGKDAKLPPDGRQGVTLPAGDLEKLDSGLLGIAETNKVVRVLPSKSKKSYGLATFAAVVEAISSLNNDLQGPPYGLILAPDVFADASLPLEDEALVTPASAIQSILASGPFVVSPGMPNRTGLLASLGGKTTSLYVGTGPLVEFNTLTEVYSFIARESIQLLNIDARSLIKLKFEDAPRP